MKPLRERDILEKNHSDSSNKQLKTETEEITNNKEKQEKNEGFRLECSICKRKFNEERIEIHEKACGKAQKKRPLYNSSLKRV